MRNSVRLGIAVGGVVLFSGLTSVLMVGCGGDDTAVGDAGMGTDTKQDSPGIDAEADVITVTDSGIDAKDVGVPTILDYSHQINVAFCNRLAECCGPTAFDLDLCVSSADSPANTGVASQNMIAPFLDGGHITFDLTKAKACIDKVKGLTCGLATSAYLTDLITTCYSGAVGNIPLGAKGCLGSAECAPPNHCDVTPDAGTCTAPRAAGTACGPVAGNEFEGHAQCGGLLTGVPGYCSNSGNNYLGNDQCSAQKTLGGGCYEAVECQSNICGDPTDPVLRDAGVSQCNAGYPIANIGICANYLRDAGPG